MAPWPTKDSQQQTVIENLSQISVESIMIQIQSILAEVFRSQGASIQIVSSWNAPIH